MIYARIPYHYARFNVSYALFAVRFTSREIKWNNVTAPLTRLPFTCSHPYLCLDSSHHYAFPATTYSFDDLFKLFWSKPFSSIDMRMFGGSFKAWEELSTKEVIASVRLRSREKLADFKEAITDLSLLRKHVDLSEGRFLNEFR
jgi:hypothetical protein